MDNPEKLTTLGFSRREKKQTHNTICVGHRIVKRRIEHRYYCAKKETHRSDSFIK